MSLLANPRSSYGQTATNTPVGAIVGEFVASGAVGVGQCVALSEASGALTVAATGATTDNFVGVALNDAVAGDVVRVVTHGPALARTTTGLTLGASATTRNFSGGANGRIVAVPTTLGHVVGGRVNADVTGKTTDTLVSVFVCPSMAYAS